MNINILTCRRNKGDKFSNCNEYVDYATYNRIERPLSVLSFPKIMAVDKFGRFLMLFYFEMIIFLKVCFDMTHPCEQYFYEVKGSWVLEHRNKVWLKGIFASFTFSLCLLFLFRSKTTNVSMSLRGACVMIYLYRNSEQQSQSSQRLSETPHRLVHHLRSVLPAMASGTHDNFVLP